MDLTKFDFPRLAKRIQTPFYLYDLDGAIDHLQRLRAALGPDVHVYYGMKANPNAGVLGALREHLDGLDVSSAGEIDMAAQLGYSPSAMSLAGPGKIDADLRRAVAAGLGALSVESMSEMQRAAQLARAMNKRVAITIRINPLYTPKEFAMKMGGQASQFGIGEEEAGAAIEMAKATEGLQLQGLHVFAGTQCLELPGIIENLRQTLALAARLAHEHDLHPQVINLGGGFGVAYFEGQQPLDPTPLGQSLREVLDAYRRETPRLQHCRFVFELGRYLIADYGAYVCRVLDVKVTRGKRFAVLDGGMHHCFAATGFFGQLVKKNYPVALLGRQSSEPPVPQELVGPLCTPMDSMGRAVRLPPLQPGDLVAILAAGAYCYTASPLLFLGHDTPPEAVARQGSVEVTRPRRPITTLFASTKEDP